MAGIAFTDASAKTIPAGGGYVETVSGGSLATWHRQGWGNFDPPLRSIRPNG